MFRKVVIFQNLGKSLKKASEVDLQQFIFYSMTFQDDFQWPLQIVTNIANVIKVIENVINEFDRGRKSYQNQLTNSDRVLTDFCRF